MAQPYAKYTCWYGFWIKRDEIAADVSKCLPLACFTTLPDSTLVALLGKVLAHWIQTAAIAPAQFMDTRTERARRSYVTRCARILKNRLFEFCGAFQSFRKRCYQHQNRTTGAALLHNIPQNDTSSAYWSCRALKSHVPALMGAVRQYQSHTTGNLSKLDIAPVI